MERPGSTSPSADCQEAPAIFVYRIESIITDWQGPFGTPGMADAYNAAAAQAIRDRSELIPAIPPSETFAAHRSGLFDPLPITSEHLFGCASLDQLRTWFPSAVGCVAMVERGAVLAVYRVPPEHVLAGPYEVAFDRRHGKLVDWYSLRDLHEGTLPTSALHRGGRSTSGRGTCIESNSSTLPP